jgi:hypothetical protein
MARRAVTSLWLGATLAAPAFPAQGSDPAARKAAALAQLEQRRVAASPASLRKAATDGDAALVKTLLDAGVHPKGHGPEPPPRSVLGLVVSSCRNDKTSPAPGRDAVIAALLEGGADPNFMELGRLPLLVAAAEACPRRVIEALVKAGAEIDGRSPRGLTALPVALTRNLDAAEALVDLGARITPGQRAALFPDSPTDPRLAAVLERASAPAAREK